MRLHIWVLITFFCIYAPQQAASDQNHIVLEECPELADALVDELVSKVECLEKKINDLVEMQNILLNTQVEIDKQIEEKTQKIYDHIFGPTKDMKIIEPVPLAVTIAYWSDGNAKQEFYCVQPLEVKEGKTLIGGELSGEERLTGEVATRLGTNFRGCANTPFCDSGGEFCNVRSRNGGCYINTSWYDWYLDGQKRKNLPVDSTVFCSE